MELGYWKLWADPKEEPAEVGVEGGQGRRSRAFVESMSSSFRAPTLGKRWLKWNPKEGGEEEVVVVVVVLEQAADEEKESEKKGEAEVEKE